MFLLLSGDGMKVEQANRLKHFEKENAWLQGLPAEAELDTVILRQASRALAQKIILWAYHEKA